MGVRVLLHGENCDIGIGISIEFSVELIYHVHCWKPFNLVSAPLNNCCSTSFFVYFKFAQISDYWQ